MRMIQMTTNGKIESNINNICLYNNVSTMEKSFNNVLIKTY
jgi:hypothetical protein